MGSGASVKAARPPPPPTAPGDSESGPSTARKCSNSWYERRRRRTEQEQVKPSLPKKGLWSKCKSLISCKKKIDGEGSQVYREHVDHQTLPITEVGNHDRVTEERPILLNLDAYSRFRPDQVLDRQEEGPAERRSKGCKERNKGSSKSSKSLQSNRLSSANSEDGARATEKVCLSTVTEHYMEQTEQLSEKITDLKVSVDSTEKESDFYVSNLCDIEILCQKPELEHLPTWEMMQCPGDSSRDMFGECDCEGDGAYVVGAARDIFLVQPRDGGVPPSWFQTLRQAGWSYWRGALKFAMKIGTLEDIPRSWSWESVMGRPAYGDSDGCAVMAIATCIRARHCIAFERRYGAGTFKLQLSDVHMLYLVEACLSAGVIEPNIGAKLSSVVSLMKKQDLWIRTHVADAVGAETYLLRWNRVSFLHLKYSTSPPDLAAACIYLNGPIIGTICTGPDYTRGDYDEEYVYRGDPGDPNHAVVCMGYRYKDGEIHLRVLDNIASHGPLRWILFEAFVLFYSIEIEPLDRAALQQQQQSNKGLGGILLV